MTIQRIAVDLGRSQRESDAYEVLVGRDVLESVAELVGDRRRVILTDTTVGPLHRHRLGPLVEAPTLAIEPGEGSKSFRTLESILEFLSDADLDRSSCVIALGGGAVGDIGGLAASLYMRGISIVHCPTTLLAQVDASVGGKTALNLERGKNLAGTFHQPIGVVSDVGTLATLHAREIRSGLGEVVKTALVGDPDLLTFLEEGVNEVVRGDPEQLIEIVARSVRVKAEIVARDEREGGERKKLNLGHTFAHAIEHCAGFGTIPHGEAVAVGITLAIACAARSGLLKDPELPRRTASLLARLGLAESLAGLRSRCGLSLSADELIAAMRHDKKGRAGEPALVLPERAGTLRADQVVEPDDLARVLA